jgi:hypothetical protein
MSIQTLTEAELNEVSGAGLLGTKGLLAILPLGLQLIGLINTLSPGFTGKAIPFLVRIASSPLGKLLF